MKDGSQAFLSAEPPGISKIGSPLPDILYAISISPTWTIFSTGIFCMFADESATVEVHLIWLLTINTIGIVVVIIAGSVK